MWKTLLWFLVRLSVVSIVLYVVWEWQGRMAYTLLFRAVAIPVYGLFGIQPNSLRDAANVVVDRFYNILPFLSLMAAMWGINWKRRLWGTLSGFGAVIVWHACFLLIVRAILGNHQLDSNAYRLLSPWFLLSDALPFLLWVVICHRPLFAVLQLNQLAGLKGPGAQ